MKKLELFAAMHNLNPDDLRLYKTDQGTLLAFVLDGLTKKVKDVLVVTDNEDWMPRPGKGGLLNALRTA